MLPLLHKTLLNKVHNSGRASTNLQSMMNVKLSKQRLRHCYVNGLIKTIQMIPCKLDVSFMLASLYQGLRVILVYPNLW